MPPGLTITVDMDKTCPKCGTKGVGGSGVCLRCFADRITASADQRLIEIRKLQQSVDFTASDLESLKSQTKTAREQWEKAVEELGDYIRGADPVLPMETVDEATGEETP